MKTFAIVGAGNAGLGAALELRRQGFDGNVLLFGKEPLLPYERPPLSKAQLASSDTEPFLLKSAEFLEMERIEVRTDCEVDRIDPAAARLHLAGGGSVPYDEVLIATGGRPRTLESLPGGDHALTLRTHADAIVLRAKLAPRRGRLVIIGAGVIGLEVASTSRSLGWDVTVLEFADRPMARVLTPGLSTFIASRHAAAGVDLRCGVTVHSIEAARGGKFVVTSSTGNEEADLVVAGVGMQPDIRLAVDAGLQTTDAILVDELARTSAAHVHAAGDVACFWHPRLKRRMRLESWQHASKHGAAAARTMLGKGSPYEELPWSWTDQFDVNVQILGMPTEADQTVLRGDKAAPKFAALHLRERRLVGATLVNLGREMRPCKALIESGAELDLGRLADDAISLRDYAAHTAPMA